ARRLARGRTARVSVEGRRARSEHVARARIVVIAGGQDRKELEQVEEERIRARPCKGHDAVLELRTAGHVEVERAERGAGSGLGAEWRVRAVHRNGLARS